MVRRDFLKVIGAMGAIATLPLGAITNIKEYPTISYHVTHLPHKPCYLHKVSGNSNNTTWEIFEYSDDKILPNDIFLRMVEEVNKKVLFS